MKEDNRKHVGYVENLNDHKNHDVVRATEKASSRKGFRNPLTAYSRQEPEDSSTSRIEVI